MPVLEIRNLQEEAVLAIWKVEETVSELEEMHPELTDTESYKSFNHDLRRLEWLAARALMKTMNLSHHLNYSEHGKPYYPNGPKISITHSKDYVAIITHLYKEVGIDVQEIIPKVERIKHKYCNEYELEWAATVEDYTLIWSAKEAMFKVKERNVHFADDIKVHPKKDEAVLIEFRGKEQFHGDLLNLTGYQGVYVVDCK